MTSINESGVWVKSRRCDSNGCVEVALLDEETVGVRNSQDPDGPVVTFTREQWLEALEEVRGYPVQ